MFAIGSNTEQVTEHTFTGNYEHAKFNAQSEVAKHTERTQKAAGEDNNYIVLDISNIILCIVVFVPLHTYWSLKK